MPFVAVNYLQNLQAPQGQWVCTRTSAHGPYTTAPPVAMRGDPNYCGQCVSLVTRACPDLPVGTAKWKKGLPVKTSGDIVDGTVIATFNANNVYSGHAAIYVRQDEKGIYVYDQWVSGTNPKAIGMRLIRWNGQGVSNNGEGFCVVEPQ
jgi:hypothetical protein